MSKNYLDLKTEVWDTGICASCGACVAVCPADAIYFKNGTDSVQPFNNDYCKEVNDGVPCGACYATCPRLDISCTETMGNYIEIYSIKAETAIQNRQSGGAVTAILSDLLEKKIIDAVVTVEADPWTLMPNSTVITSKEKLINNAGSRYNWWVPLVASLKEAIMVHKYKHVAVVGLPCVVQAIRKIMNSDHDLLRPFKNSIKLVIGLFCTETFDYHKLFKNIIMKEYNIEPTDILHFDVKGKIIINLKNKDDVVIPLNDIKECIRPGCRTCTDFSALDADISAGSVGSCEGYTTIIARSHIGAAIIHDAFEHRILSKNNRIDVQIIEKLSQKKASRFIQKN